MGKLVLLLCFAIFAMTLVMADPIGEWQQNYGWWGCAANEDCNTRWNLPCESGWTCKFMPGLQPPWSPWRPWPGKCICQNWLIKTQNEGSQDTK